MTITISSLERQESKSGKHSNCSPDYATMVLVQCPSSTATANVADNVTTPNKPRLDSGIKRTVGRSRRRRPMAGTPSTAAIDSAVDKENRRHCRSARHKANITSTPVQSSGKDIYSIHYHDDDEFVSLAETKDEHSSSHLPIAASLTETTAQYDIQNDGQIFEACCREFRRSSKKASVPFKLWRIFPDLPDTIIRMSLSKSITAESLGLTEHSTALLNFSRKLIKDVNSAAKSPRDNLFVAVHVLRSVSFVFADTATIEQKESLLKLFYHLITVAVDIEGTKGGNNSQENGDKHRLKWIAIAGYEGLASILSHYSIKQKFNEGEQRTVSFQLTRNDFADQNLIDERIIFAVPSTARRKLVDSKTSSFGTMSIRQLSTIALKTTMVVAKAILHLDPIEYGCLSSCYGSLAIIPALDFCNEGEKGTCRFQRIALRILRQIYGPWLSLLASDMINEREVAKEVISYSKSTHRLLWDAASTLKSRSSPDRPKKCTSCSNDNNHNKIIESDCLELRKHAILHLLPCTGVSEIDLLIRKTSLENGCTYAWKAAMVFSQHMASCSSDAPAGKSLLSKMYTELESTFARFVDMDPVVPLGLIEYKVYKTLHLGSFSTTTIDILNHTRSDSIEFSIGDDELQNGNYRILFYILELGLLSKTRIESSSNIEKSMTATTSTSLLDKLILSFNQQITFQLDKFSSDVLNRVLKAFCNLSLHKTLYLWIKQQRNSGDQSATNLSESELFTVSTILTECLGPFMSVFVHKYPQKAPQLVDLVMECFLRPLSFYEYMLIQRQTEDNEYKRRRFERHLHISTVICEKLADIFTNFVRRRNDFIVPIHSLEKAAKSLYVMAKERNERSLGVECIPPLLFSIKLYDKLDVLNGHKKDYQMSSRLFFLSSIFMSNGKAYESFFVSCMVINRESQNKSATATSSAESKEQNLLNYFAALSWGLLPPSSDEAPMLPQTIRTLCRQMALNVGNAEKWSMTEGLIAHADESFVHCLIESFHEESTGNESMFQTIHPIDSIRLLLDFENIIDDERRLVHLFSVLEITIQVGQSMGQLSRDSDGNGTQIEDTLHNYSCLHNLLQKAIIDLDLECTRSLLGLLDLIASASLVPDISRSMRKNAFHSDHVFGFDTPLVNTAMSITKDCLEQLKLSVGFRNERTSGLLCESLRITLLSLLVMLQRRLRETDCFNDLLTECVSVAEAIVSSENEIDSRSIRWTIWTITIVQNELEIIADHDRAAILSLWTLALAKKIEPYQPWFQASAMTAFAKESNVTRMNDSVTIASCVVTTAHGSPFWIFEKEFQLCKLRSEALKLDAHAQESFCTQMQQVEDIQLELEKSMVEKDDDMFVLHTWVLSTAYIVQCDISLVFGCYLTASKTAQMCQRLCQMIMKRASFRVKKSDNWMSVIATSTVLTRASQRYIQVLFRRSNLQYRLGDHRKAIAYMRSVLEYLKIDPDSLTLKERHDVAPKDLGVSLGLATQIRHFLEVKSWASTNDTTVQELSYIKPKDLKRCYSNDSYQSQLSIVHSIQDMIVVGDILYGDSMSIKFQQTFHSFYQEAAALIAEKAGNIKEIPLTAPINMQGALGMPVFNKVKLRDIRGLLESSHELEKDLKMTIRNLCIHIEESEFSSPEDKAWSLYYLGVLELDNARRSGALHQMWNDHGCGEHSCSSSSDDENIRFSRLYLSKALLHSTSGSDIFRRNVLRSLALAQGPKNNDGIGNSAGILVLTSIGQSIRRKLSYSFDQDRESHEGESLRNLRDVFSFFDVASESDKERDEKISEFLRELAVRTPSNWEYVAPVICPSGELLVVIVRKTNLNLKEFVISTKCIFSLRGENAYDNIMKPLDSILARVQEHLSNGVDASLLSKSVDKEAIKRQWWNERNQLDAEMCGLLEYVESLYFASVFDSNKRLSNCPGSCTDFEELPSGNLAARFEAALNDGDDDKNSCYSKKEHQEEVDILKKLTVPKLKDRLLSIGAEKSQLRKLRKLDLIELLIQMEREKCDTKKNKVEAKAQYCEKSDDPGTCLFLILDENLHRFPFEGMPVLEAKTVCRVPCLSFVLATLCEFHGAPDNIPLVDPCNVTYVVDPENNLQATQKRILPALESLASSHKWDWDGRVGETPPVSFFSEGLSKKYGLMMYFGHGGAQVCFSRRLVEELIAVRSPSLRDQTESNKPCRAAVILMGCSSGKLVSINRKNSSSVEQTPLYYEPEGVALSYLCAGAPCVVGNLWDVTDNDIDRFSISLLQHFFGRERTKQGRRGGVSLAEGVSLSRSACKLRYLVGCAPVCYGVPVHLLGANTGTPPDPFR